MRVFITVKQDLKKAVPFQKTLPYLLELLKGQGLAPERYFFSFEDIPDTGNPPFSKTSMGKLVKAFPQLERYLLPRGQEKPHACTASNFPAVCNLTYNQPEPDQELTSGLLAEVVEKIPKPYSFYGAAIVLDAIPWFGSSRSAPALSACLPDIPCAVSSVGDYGGSCSFYQSDCIVMDKRFDWGTSYNPIYLRFEVTPFIENGTLSEADETIENFCELACGQKMEKQMVCCFTAEDMAYFDTAGKQIQTYLQEQSDVWSQLTLPSGIPFSKTAYQSVPNCPREEHFKVPNRIPYFTKLLKEDGFLWHHPKIGGDSDWGKILPQGNYALHISAGFTRNLLRVYLNCSGYNFSVSHTLASDRPCFSMDELELYAADLKVMIRLWENEVVPELRRLFGDTPEWYTHSIVYEGYVGRVIRNDP